MSPGEYEAILQLSYQAADLPTHSLEQAGVSTEERNRLLDDLVLVRPVVDDHTDVQISLRRARGPAAASQSWRPASPASRTTESPRVHLLPLGM